jgi:phage baseplate assembly protein W
MAFGAKRIFPIDTTPGTAVGINIPFNAPSVFSPSYTTKDATKNNLINYFLTNIGDRYDNPTFGGNLREYVFEQIQQNTFDSIEDDIQQKIATYFPTVAVSSINISKIGDQTDYNTIVVEINYNIVGTGQTDTLQIAFT